MKFSSSIGAFSFLRIIWNSNRCSSELKIIGLSIFFYYHISAVSILALISSGVYKINIWIGMLDVDSQQE